MNSIRVGRTSENINCGPCRLLFLLPDHTSFRAESRFNGLSRDNGVRAQSAACVGTHRVSQVPAKAVVLRQQIRLLLEQQIDKMFIQRRRILDDL